MGKTVLKQSESKGNLLHKKMGAHAVDKERAGNGIAKERAAVSGRFVEAVRRPSPMRSKVSEYTREEANWLNSLVDSAAKDAIDKG